jgi:hypothetical protein
VSRPHVEVFEFGDTALFETEPERGAGEADNVAVLLDHHDAGVIRVHQHREILAQLRSQCAESVLGMKRHC